MRGNLLNYTRSAVESIRKRFSAKALILGYHRVADLSSDPWGLCVTPRHFAQHLDVLKKFTRPLSLRQLGEAHRTNRIPDGGVAVTFDDGYADNLHNAKPLLEKYDVPATVFVVAGQIDSQREFWWDELERAVLQPETLPRELRLQVNGEVHRWDLADAAEYGDYGRRQDRGRKPWEGPAGSRLSLYYSVWQKLRSLPPDKREMALDAIVAWASSGSTPRAEYRTLCSEELHALANGGLCEIGSHTFSHLRLPDHTIAKQRQDIGRGKSLLEQVIDLPVMSFAYPYGDFSAETVRLVRELGFTSACTTRETAVWKNSDCFRFPRYTVENWTGDEFETRLLRWLSSSSV